MAAFPTIADSAIISVKELIKEPLMSIPQEFIRLDCQIPPPSTTLLSDDSNLVHALPIIDMKQLDSTSFEDEKLHSACKEWGFFQVVNHGVSSSIMEELKYEIEEFYKLPLEKKLKYKIRPGDVEGYGSACGEGKLDWGDRFYMTTNPITRRKPYLFSELPSSLRNILECYITELQKLGMKILMVMARALKVGMKEMEELFDDGMQSMRMTYYPPCPKPDLVMGLSEHSDATGITILNQLNGVDGLEINKDGLWIPVNFHRDSLVVNVGDTLEILSNGNYSSIEHRATVNSMKERISIAFFMNPKLEADVGPIKGLINSRNPPLFKKIGMEDYVKGFFSHKLDGKSHLQRMKFKTHEVEGAPDNVTLDANN